MRVLSPIVVVAAALLPLSASAQCFNRAICGDPSALEVRSQITVNVPIADQKSPSDVMKIMEDARRDLYAMSSRECDTLQTTFGGDCSLSSVNINSSVQERGLGSKSAYISISNVYAVKRPAK